MISICTPTYNRAPYLLRVYDSLLAQDYTDFEWIIVDDGSTDDTAKVLKSLVEKALFPIVVISQPNSGKHIAVNKALNVAKGELFIILDSDDTASVDMLRVCADEWNRIEERDGICGMTFLDMYRDGKIVGTEFPFERHRASLTKFYHRYAVTGDKCNVHITEVFRKFRFPDTEGERFCPEALIWNRMAAEFDTVFINKAIKHVEYLADGLSANIIKIRARSPINSVTFYDELMLADISLSSRVRAAVNLLRFAFHGRLYNQVFLKYPLVSIALFFPALVFYCADRWRVKP